MSRSTTDAGERELADIATRLLFENERVRIWEMRVEAGEEWGLHRHDLDHILVQISGDRMAVVPHADSKGPFREYLEGDVVPGQFFYVERGGLEAARNVGDREYHELIIELKD